MLTATDIAKLNDDAKANAKEALELTNAIVPLLAGKDPGVQSCVLASLLAAWLCELPKARRGLELHLHMGHVLDLVKIEQMKRGSDG